FVEITSAQFTTGCTLFAWYNHSAGRALRTTGTSIADVRAGVDANYYYVIRAVDRAGNIAYCAELPGKIQTEFFTSWNLLCNPFLEGPTPIEEALDGLNWTAAKTWIPENAPHQWTSYVLGRIPELNTLHTITPGTGMWVRMEPSSNYTAAGTVSNISINLSPGWNLVSYPYHEIMTVSQALAGVPWDRVEIMDQYSYGFITEISGTDLLYPGHGLWVHVTSSAVWNVVNVP
ncbi:MAG: hypothetical protein Q7J68_02145, partial [Thermoplasmata archaeon]|nr:hypothetical protein [Thermoplasmata archaeon]